MIQIVSLPRKANFNFICCKLTSGSYKDAHTITVLKNIVYKAEYIGTCLSSFLLII